MHPTGPLLDAGWGAQYRARMASRLSILRSEQKPHPLTQQELAARAGVALRTVQNIEAGRGANTGTMLALARALGVSIADLFDQEQAS